MEQLATAFAGRTEEGSISGLASVFGSTAYGKMGATRFRPGAFVQSLKANGGKLPLLYQHDAAKPIGAVTARETSTGLEFSGRISDTNLGRDVRELLRDGAISGVSIGFDPAPSSISYETRAGERIRFVGAANVVELSICTFPADKAARVLTVHQELLRRIDDEPAPADLRSRLARIELLARRCGLRLVPLASPAERFFRGVGPRVLEVGR